MKFKDIISRKKFQRKNNRNRDALHSLSALGFSMPAVRMALLKLNEIRANDLKDGTGVTNLDIHRTLKGKKYRRYLEARKLIATRLQLEIYELFP